MNGGRGTPAGIARTPDEASESRRERDEAARWSRFWTGRERPEEFYPPSPRSREHLLPHAGAGTRVLEVGAGSGRDGAALAARGARVVLLDASAGALELA